MPALTESARSPSTPDPAGALVYSVDDDADNCECITAALEKAKPSLAAIWGRYDSVSGWRVDDIRERFLKIFANIVAQGLERRNINHPRLIRQFLHQSFAK